MKVSVLPTAMECWQEKDLGVGCLSVYNNYGIAGLHIVTVLIYYAVHNIYIA